MLWSCQKSSTRNFGLDQYPILYLPRNIKLSATYIAQRAWILDGCPGPGSFPGPAPGIFPRTLNIAIRLPVPWVRRHSWVYSILPDLRNCLFLINIMINTAALTFVLSVSANFRQSFCALLHCSFDHSLRSYFGVSRGHSGQTFLLVSFLWGCKMCKKYPTEKKRAHEFFELCTS